MRRAKLILQSIERNVVTDYFATGAKWFKKAREIGFVYEVFVYALCNDAIRIITARKVNQCDIVRAVFDPDGFCMKTLFQGFGYGVCFWFAAVWGAAGHENGFAGLLLQVGAVA